jgi:hypothetical protein
MFSSVNLSGLKFFASSPQSFLSVWISKGKKMICVRAGMTVESAVEGIDKGFEFV